MAGQWEAGEGTMPRKNKHRLLPVAGDAGEGSAKGDTHFVMVEGRGVPLRVPHSPAAKAVRAEVSDAEWRVLLAMVNGLDERHAARALGIALGTVKTQGRMARVKAGRILGMPFGGGSASKRLVLVLVGFLHAPNVKGSPRWPSLG